jgi:hypothetical protein
MKTASSNTQELAPVAPPARPLCDYFDRERRYRKRHGLDEDAIIFSTDLYTREELIAAAQQEIRRCISESGVAA